MSKPQSGTPSPQANRCGRKVGPDKRTICGARTKGDVSFCPEHTLEALRRVPAVRRLMDAVCDDDGDDAA